MCLKNNKKKKKEIYITFILLSFIIDSLILVCLPLGKKYVDRDTFMHFDITIEVCYYGNYIENENKLYTLAIVVNEIIDIRTMSHM